MLKIFQNILNMICHDIINPVNSIMLYISSFNNIQSPEIINDRLNQIINCVNSARYSYCMMNNQYKLEISQIKCDWKKIFDQFDVSFDEKITELDDFLVQIIFCLLIFVQESINSQNHNEVCVSHSSSQINLSFKKKLNEVIMSKMRALISEDILQSEINPMNASLHFFQYLIKKNNMKILLTEDEFVIQY